MTSSNLQVFTIDLADKAKEYRAGDKVFGHVLIQPKKDINCKRVTLQLRLFEYSYHAEERVRESETTHFEQTIRIYGKGSGSSDEKAEKKLCADQKYAFPFKFQFPSKVVSTVDICGKMSAGPFGTVRFEGHIKCSLKAKIIASSWSLKKSPEALIYLQTRDNIDTTSSKELLESKTEEVDTKSYGGLLGFSVKDSFHLESKISKTGFKPGESIVTSCKIKSTSAKAPIPKAIKVSLIRSCTAKRPGLAVPFHCLEEVLVAKFPFEAASSGGTSSTGSDSTWEKEATLSIPADLTYSISSKLVITQYSVVWEVIVGDKEPAIGKNEHRSEIAVVIGDSASAASAPVLPEFAASVPDYPEEAGEASAPEVEHDAYWPEEIPPAFTGETTDS